MRNGYEIESMKASTQERVPSGGDRREPQRPDLRHIGMAPQKIIMAYVYTNMPFEKHHLKDS